MGLLTKKLILFGVCGLIAILLIVRLVQLQLLNQEEYGRESQKNAVKTITITPARGLMFDRNNQIVVDNRPTYTVTITPNEFDTTKYAEVSLLLGIPEDKLREELAKIKGTNRFNPQRIKRDVDFKTIAYIAENEKHLNGVDYQVESLRLYSDKFRASHIFGYVKEISEKQLANQIGDYYKQGDLIGVKGLEKTYEDYLRGEKGYEFVNVDVKGREIGSVNDGRDDIKPVNGSDIYLSIDAQLQEYAESLMNNKRGAVIAMDPKTGEILCMVSKPDFDLNVFSGPTDPKILSALMTDKDKPLFNRVTMTNYPPGSTWKMMMGLAGLASGDITTTSLISCPGSFVYGGRSFGDHGAYGSINITRALEVSANTFFYKLALQMGLDNYHKYSAMFGFGKKTGIDISDELPGRLPSVEYYNKVYGVGKWTQGFIVSLGIGQGELGVTPVQMVAYTSAIAMDGLYTTPHFVRKIVNSNTKEEIYPSFKTTKIDFPQKWYDAIKKGMYLVVNGNGTAKGIKNSLYTLAGKTGTAQTQGNNHSWFVGYAPYEDPKIAICVLGENAGWGAQFAAPLAAAVMVRYLSGNSIDSFDEEGVKIFQTVD
ncbi:MAG TPA: penicillin-binding protein 2 [Bacteroidetes bacterium]|nr:penicillin-binding protein 2 [Ignavibacteria bacterium]HCA43896.1 penicillin-binding protein 2 [Bacteroidota bacterium]HCN38621.1 penicillin-binding protein 2 [Bacteroidota bacterium]